MYYIIKYLYFKRLSMLLKRSQFKLYRKYINNKFIIYKNYLIYHLVCVFMSFINIKNENSN